MFQVVEIGRGIRETYTVKMTNVEIGYGYAFDGDEEWLGNHVGIGALLWYRSL